MGEDMMQKMMQEFEKLGEKEDFQQVVDGMMRQLLSKEVMYDPMKQITEKFMCNKFIINLVFFSL